MIYTKSSNLSTFSGISLLILMTIFMLGGGGCSINSVTIATDAEMPAVETAELTDGSRSWSNAAIAWREQSENGDDAAITTYFWPMVFNALDQVTISGTTSDTGPVQFVRLGEDRYFIGWIDDSEAPPRLHWQIVSATDWSQIAAGDYVYLNWPVSDFAAAYQLERESILVAVLSRAYDENENYRECVLEGTSSCALTWFTIDANGSQSPNALPRQGSARGVSVAAGKDGFLVANATTEYGNRGDTTANQVRIYFVDAEGALSGYSSQFGTIITGKCDCSETPAEFVGENYILNDSLLDKTNSNFKDTVVAYDSANDRFLVGYTTACYNKQYYRARWVKLVEDATQDDEYEATGIYISGVAEGAYSSAGGLPKTVEAPPFQIAESASEPMLTYSEYRDGYFAGYGSPYTHTPYTDRTFTRQVFYTKFLTEDVSVPDEQVGILSGCNESGYGYYCPEFITGDIVTDPESGRFWAVWAQRSYGAPCTLDTWTCTIDQFDWDNLEWSSSTSVELGYTDGFPWDEWDE